MMTPMHDQPRPHRPSQRVQRGTAGRVAAWCFMRHQDIGLLTGQGVVILWPDRGGSQRMHLGVDMVGTPAAAHLPYVLRQFHPSVQARRLRGLPYPWSECSTQPGNPDTFNDGNACMQG